jgi:hypothetical protein
MLSDDSDSPPPSDSTQPSDPPFASQFAELQDKLERLRADLHSLQVGTNDLYERLLHQINDHMASRLSALDNSALQDGAFATKSRDSELLINEQQASHLLNSVHSRSEDVIRYKIALTAQLFGAAASSFLRHNSPLAEFFQKGRSDFKAPDLVHTEKLAVSALPTPGFQGVKPSISERGIIDGGVIFLVGSAALLRFPRIQNGNWTNISGRIASVAKEGFEFDINDGKNHPIAIPIRLLEYDLIHLIKP